MRGVIVGILLAVLFAFVFAGAFAMSLKFFDPGDRTFANNASAAFLGAFLAFIFVRIGDFFKSIADREEKGREALLKIQIVLNANLGVLDDNVHTIESFESLYRAWSRESENHVFVWTNRLKPAQSIAPLLPGVTNHVALNRLLCLDTTYRKISDDMGALNLGYEESKDAMIGNRITMDNYFQNVERLQTELKQFQVFIRGAIDESISSLATCRVILRKKSPASYVTRIFRRLDESPAAQEAREKEEAVIRTEIAEIGKESTARLDELTGGGKSAA